MPRPMKSKIFTLFLLLFHSLTVKGQDSAAFNNLGIGLKVTPINQSILGGIEAQGYNFFSNFNRDSGGFLLNYKAETYFGSSPISKSDQGEFYLEYDINLDGGLNFIFGPFAGISAKGRFIQNAETLANMGGFGLGVSSGIDSEDQSGFFVHIGGLLGNHIYSSLLEPFKENLNVTKTVYQQKDGTIQNELLLLEVDTERQEVTRNDLAQLLEIAPDQFEIISQETFELENKEQLQSIEGLYISAGVFNIIEFANTKFSLQTHFNHYHTEISAPADTGVIPTVGIEESTVYVNNLPQTTRTYLYENTKITDYGGLDLSFSRTEFSLDIIAKTGKLRAFFQQGFAYNRVKEIRDQIERVSKKGTYSFELGVLIPLFDKN